MHADSSKPVRLLPILVAGALFAACGGDGTAPNQSPSASISQPGNGATFAEGQSITFQGSASDPEDGSLSGSSLRWSSSLDGQIGTGGSFTRSDLSVGSHTIRLVATDAGGEPDTASVSITVEVSSAPTITAVSPDPLVAGQAGTITGENFNATASRNRVTVGGIPVPVTLATTTSLEISVPAGLCLVQGTYDVVVAVDGDASNGFAHAVDPGSVTPLNLAVGEFMRIGDPTSFCLQLASSSTSERYLVGVQSTSESVTRLDDVEVVAVSGSGGGAPARVPTQASRSGGVDLRELLRGPAERRMEAHRRAEARFRERERMLADRLLALGPRPAAAPGPLTIPSDVQVGDTIDARVTDVDATNLCTSFAEVRAVVRVVGTRGVWLEDVENPSGGYTTTDFQSLSDAMDAAIYVADSAYFGAPTDIDGNDRVAVLITKEVNVAGGLLGFVFSGDLFPRTDCAASNEGEIYYGVAPDPDGEFGDTLTVEEARADNKNVLAHELVHVIQDGVRLNPPTFENALPSQPPWVTEGQAVLGEEVVGHAITDNMPRQNYGIDVAFGAFGPDGIQWYVGPWVDLALYYGIQVAGGSVTGQLDTAPHECSWLDRADPFGDNDGPCINDRAVYGTPFTLLRWMADHYGPSYPGGEEALVRDMVTSSSTGYDMLEALVGVPYEELLAPWAASLYVDDRVSGLDAMVTSPSWNYFNIFQNLIEEARLSPMTATFGDFTLPFRVRGGSSAYIVVSGSSRPATAIRARAPDGSPLASVMQVWVVRMQ